MELELKAVRWESPLSIESRGLEARYAAVTRLVIDRVAWHVPSTRVEGVRTQISGPTEKGGD